MSKEVIITGFSNVGKEGLTLHTNVKSRLKGSEGMATKERWVSWDKVGRALFQNYTEKVEVADRDKLKTLTKNLKL